MGSKKQKTSGSSRNIEQADRSRIDDMTDEELEAELNALFGGTKKFKIVGP